MLRTTITLPWFRSSRDITAAKTLEPGCRKLSRSLASTSLVLVLTLGLSPAVAQDRPTRDVSALGFSSDHLPRLGKVLEADIASGRVPGAVALVTRRGQIAYFEAFGVQDPTKGTPMRKDAIFRIYSMTKPVISVATLMLWEEGRFHLDDPVSRYLPDLKDLKVAVVRKDPDGKSRVDLEPARRQPTIQHLLTHTSGLSYDILPKSPDQPVRQMYVDAKVGDPNDSLAELVAKIGQLPLMAEPGTTWEYSRSTDVMARLIEVVSGQSIDTFLQTRIFEPLGMKDTGFWVPKDKLDRLAEPFAADPVTRAPVRMIDVVNPRKFLSGNIGLVSTAEDYTRFALMLLNGGTLDGTRILSRKAVEFMTVDHIGTVRGPIYVPGTGYGFGLGVAVRQTEGQVAYPGSVGDYHWAGTGGTIFWVDPKEDLTAVLMVQGLNLFSHNARTMRTQVYQALDRAPRLN